MKSPLTHITVFVLLAVLTSFAAGVEFPNPAEFNPVWKSASPGTSYDRSLPTAALLGNGSLGVVNGGDANKKLFVLTRGDLWSCGDMSIGYDDNNIGPMSFADLIIQPETPAVESTDELDLPSATLKTKGVFGKGTVQLESFVTATEDLFVITGVSDSDDVWNVRLVVHNQKPFPTDSGKSADGFWVRRSTVNLLPESDSRGWVVRATAAVSALGAQLTQIETPDGKKEASARLTIRAGEPFAIIVSANPDRRFTWAELEKLKADHKNWWTDWYGKSRIALGDKELESFWYGQVYLLGSCVRKGKLPPGLYGIWVTTDNPSWHNDFHLNYNYVATCYGAWASNRCDAADALPDPLLDYLPRAVRNAKENLQRLDRCKGHYYKNTRAYLDSRPDLADGIDDAALFPVSLGPWGVSPESDESLWSQVSDGAFQCAVFCTHWEYTLDRDYLKKVFPLLDKTANFFMAWCEKETHAGASRTGERNEVMFPKRLVSALPTSNQEPTLSGSYRYNVWDSHWEGSGLQKNSAPALGSVKHLFETLVDVAPILSEIGIDVSPEKVAAWKDFHEHLADLPVGVYNINGKPVKMLSGVENANGSANPSGGNALNLESVIPGEVFAFDVTSEFRALAVNTVDGNIALAPKTVWTCINQTPKLFAMAIRAGYPAEKIIDAFKKNQIRKFGQKNFHLHDGVHGVEKIGAMEFIQSMLIQSDHGFVKIFPNWTGADAKFENLRAKGCFLLSAEMKDGKVVRVSVTSEKGGRLRLVDPFGANPLGQKNKVMSMKEPFSALTNSNREPTLSAVPDGWSRGKTRNSNEPTIERDFKPGETVVIQNS